MPSLRYHSGRMVLIPKLGGWTLRVKTRLEVVELSLYGDDLEVALSEAEQIYADLCAITSGKPRCQDCLHWLFIEGQCGLDLPEGKRSGGKHAKDCAAFWRKL